MDNMNQSFGLRPYAQEPNEDQAIHFFQGEPLRCAALEDLDLMPERKVLGLQFRS
jgi:hypothetical protein